VNLGLIIGEGPDRHPVVARLSNANCKGLTVRRGTHDGTPPHAEGLNSWGQLHVSQSAEFIGKTFSNMYLVAPQTAFGALN
jgi:hypothetical protein